MIDEKLVGENSMLSQLQLVLTRRDTNELGFVFLASHIESCPWVEV
jgi:hypothetical protein